MKKALIVGIDSYEDKAQFPGLRGAEHGAKEVARLLSRNGDSEATVNFSVDRLLSSETRVSRAVLRQRICRLFDESDRGDVVLYFSGHGTRVTTGGYLVTWDAETDDFGIPMQEIVDLGSHSRASSIVLLLDCCYSGNTGSAPRHSSGNDLAMLRENMTVVSASLPTQVALESGRYGLFTAALLDGLQGAAADLLGAISVSSVYAHIERRFGAWDQRPVMKSYLTTPAVLRRVTGKLSLPELRRLAEHFPDERDGKHQLDPQYDPWLDPTGAALQDADEKKQELGRLFKRYRNAGLVTSSDGEDFYWVAQRSGTLELTPMGVEYAALTRKGHL
jgi:hypothetical protein